MSDIGRISNDQKITPEIARTIERQVVERLGDAETPPGASTWPILQPLSCPHCGVSLNFHGDHAIPMPEYACALMQLWAAIKNKAGWRVGYSAEFTAAVERLRKMEERI